LWVIEPSAVVVLLLMGLAAIIFVTIDALRVIGLVR
jgi:hypothetical protein